MSTARQKILDFIIEQQSTTVEELSKAFRVTPSNIRHHLSILIGQGSVTIIGKKATANRGRQAQIYCGTLQSNQNNLDQLTDLLLAYSIENSRKDEMNSLLKQIAYRMVAKLPIDYNNPTRRLYSSIRALNHMSFQAHWEAHLENPRIMLGHCPYHPILHQHPELCLMDAFILEVLLGTNVQQIEKQVLNSKGLRQCVFLLK